MGVPGVAAYVIVYVVAVPVLRGVGATEMAANMFCLIYACLSNITPPVAMSSYVAAGIADSNMTKTSLIAMKLGIAGFILPFFFLCVRNFISFLFFRCFCETSINPGHFSHMIQRCFRNLICSKPPFPVIPECRRSIHTGFISKTQIILNRNDCKISYT